MCVSDLVFVLPSASSFVLMIGWLSRYCLVLIDEVFQVREGEDLYLDNIYTLIQPGIVHARENNNVVL